MQVKQVKSRCHVQAGLEFCFLHCEIYFPDLWNQNFSGTSWCLLQLVLSPSRDEQVPWCHSGSWCCQRAAPAARRFSLSPVPDINMTPEWIPFRCRYAHTSVFKGTSASVVLIFAPERHLDYAAAPQLDVVSLFPACRTVPVSPVSGPCCPPHPIQLWETMSQALLNQNKQHTLLILHSLNQSSICAELSGDIVQIYHVYSWPFLVFHMWGFIFWRIWHVTFPGTKSWLTCK